MSRKSLAVGTGAMGVLIVAIFVSQDGERDRVCRCESALRDSRLGR